MRISSERKKLALPLLVMLIFSSFSAMVFTAAPVHAGTPSFVQEAGNVCDPMVDTCSVTLLNVSPGDLIVIEGLTLNVGASVITYFPGAFGDNRSDSFSYGPLGETFQSSGVLNGTSLCGYTLCDNYFARAGYATAIGGNTSFSFTTDPLVTADYVEIYVEEFSGSGSSFSFAGQASGALGAGVMHTSTPVNVPSPYLAVAFPIGVAFTPGASFTKTPGPTFAAMYSVAGLSGATNFPQTNSGGLFIELGLMFALYGSGSFTCSITNMDAGNYLIAGNSKFYDFSCEAQSGAIGPMNAAFSDMKVSFNDSNTGSCAVTCFSPGMPSTVILDYDNATGASEVDQGGNLVTMGTPSATSSYNSTDGVRTLDVVFPVSLNTNAITAVDRGIQLFANLSNGASRGLQYVRKDYFNILLSGDGGGSISHAVISGLCSIPSGADVFQTICAYGSDSHNWIAENATFYQLQQYQAQFSIETLDQYGNPSSAFWQNYANSGSGTNPSSNAGDWHIDAGLYYWDNTSSTCCWVQGIHVQLSMKEGRVGSSNLWTEIDAVWNNGKNQIANQTFYAFVPDDTTGSQVNVWLNFWYSQNNGSSNEGGEVGAYFTGMHKVGGIISSSWSPFLGNQSSVQVFTPIVDHSGYLMNAGQVQLTKVYMNMSRPGAPEVHTNQANFEILTSNFQEQEFNTAPGGIMTGIATPTFAIAVVPVLQSNSIFSPIINALKSVATLIAKALVNVGTLIWSGLGSRFPWFTGSLSFMAGFIVNLLGFVETIFFWIFDVLKFTYGLIGIVFYPISAIIGAWDYILGTYGGIFKGADLQAMIEIVVIYIFVGWVLDNAEKGNGTAFLEAATMGWRIADSMAWWVWAIAKFFIDAAEGLIP